MPADLPDIVTNSQRESICRLQRDVLEAVARRKPLAEIMDLVCLRAENLAPELLCTVLLVDKDGKIHPCAAPGVAAAYCAAIDGQAIGPKAGSCGTAAWRGEHVEVTDIATDPLWDDYRDLALPLGLAACWSSPIKSDGRVVATFAVYYHEPRRAGAFHREMVEACVDLCSIAVRSEEATAEIHRLAFYDQLTGLPNRILLGDRADIAMSRGEPLTIVLIDLDHFKTINDSLGYAVGDRFLREVAQRLRAAAPGKETLYRLGGDEFALLLPGIGGAKAADVIDRVRDTLSTRVELDGIALSSNASIGVSVFPDDASDFDQLLKNAEVAMYQAKAAGRDCYRFFKSEMDDAAMHRLQLEGAIRRAIPQKEFTLVYQPQIKLDGHSIHGVEVLVRWNHTEWGRISPDRFIPLAEECGLIDDIDSWVLHEACAQLEHWDREGIRVPTIAVNVSARSFRNDNVPRRVADALRKHGLDGERLIVEITEGLMMNPSESTDLAFAALRALKVRVSVDDFGTGYSSLGYLKRFPVSEIKLDQSFVSDLEHNRGDQALSSAVIRIGQALGLTVVAEGVETAAQLEFLRAEGCEVAQGFFFSKPLPPAELAHWITRYQTDEAHVSNGSG